MPKEKIRVVEGDLLPKEGKELSIEVEPEKPLKIAFTMRFPTRTTTTKKLKNQPKIDYKRPKK